MNLKKTKIIVTVSIREVLLDGMKIEIVDNFIYFGWKINQDTSSENEIRRRITKGK